MSRRTLGILALAVALTACANSPTGRRQMTLLAPDQLASQGDAAFAQMTQAKPTVNNAALNRFIHCVTDPLLAAAGQNPAEWSIAVFADDEPNAFAMPGNNIGVHSGLNKVARTPDQLAAIIGHEIAHVLANHSNERISQQMAVQGGLSVVDALIGNAQTTQIAGLGAQLGVLLPFSRVHEQEADRLGLEIMARAGFDPRQAVTLWQNMQQYGGAAPPEFLSTHPASGNRMADLNNRMPQVMPLYEQARAEGRAPQCRYPG